MEHRRYHDTHTVIFWNGNAASDDEHATRAVLQVGRDGWAIETTFEWPAQRGEMEKLERMLAKAFAFGQSTAKAEIRSVLGVQDPRW